MMKVLVFTVLAALVWQQTNAFLFHHDWYDYEDEISPYCNSQMGRIFYMMGHKTTYEDLAKMDEKFLNCVIQMKVMEYIIDDKGTNNNNNVKIPNLNGMVNTADIATGVNAANALLNSKKLKRHSKTEKPTPTTAKPKKKDFGLLDILGV